MQRAAIAVPETLPCHCYSCRYYCCLRVVAEDDRSGTTLGPIATMGCLGFSWWKHLVVSRRGRSVGEYQKTWTVIALYVTPPDDAGAIFTQTDLVSSSSLELWVIGSSHHVHLGGCGVGAVVVTLL